MSRAETCHLEIEPTLNLPLAVLGQTDRARRSDPRQSRAMFDAVALNVESTVMKHSAVAEVAVIGNPDPEQTEIVKAFIVLRAGYEASDAHRSDIQATVRTRLLTHTYPERQGAEAYFCGNLISESSPPITVALSGVLFATFVP